MVVLDNSVKCARTILVLVLLFLFLEYGSHTTSARVSISFLVSAYGLCCCCVGLANEAMDSRRSWLTVSDDDHTEQYDISVLDQPTREPQRHV
jgi:hypothetical protein